MKKQDLITVIVYVAVVFGCIGISFLYSPSLDATKEQIEVLKEHNELIKYQNNLLNELVKSNYESKNK